MTYGKLDNGVLIVAGPMVKDGGREYYNPTAKTLAQLGYKAMVETVAPVKDSAYFEPAWQATPDGKLTQTWVEHLQEQTPVSPYEQRIRQLEEKLNILEISQMNQAVKITALDNAVKISAITEVLPK